MDRTIGRVVERLKATHELENTLIMVLSDNGACGEWDPFGFDGESGPGNILHTGEDLAAMGGPLSYMSYGSGWASACVTPYRYYKQYTHEGGVRTPFLVHFPAGTRLRPGSAIHRPSSITDVMFTCVEAAGAEYPREHAGVAILPGEGVSLLPLLRGDPVAARPIFIEHEGSKAVRDGVWKLVRERGASSWELYNLAKDPTEMHDLSASDPTRVAIMEAAWNEWARRCGVPQTGGQDGQAD
jgi:arylsulfatase A-like enzyme